MLVAIGSGSGTWRSTVPSGAITVMQPVISVATQMLPRASTAMLSKRWYPGRPQTRRPPCGDGNGWRFGRPGPSRSKAQSRPVSVSETYTTESSGDRPTPFGISIG
jgi:hypothetical protein